MGSKASLFDLVGDLVIYRDLNPLDTRLPRFVDAWSAMGLPGPARLRKLEPAYAQAMAWILRQARRLDCPGVNMTELVLIGDTVLNDGNAFRNLRVAGRWPGWAFIGSERDEELAVSEKDGVYIANRWGALAEFASWLVTHQGAALDRRTAVVIDIDKTALAARGRNDSTIDRARVAAVEATVADTLGPAFNVSTFRRAYHELNTVKYHSFTADNQDYIAYICLMVSAQFISLGDLLADIAAGHLQNARDFMARVEERQDQLPGTALRALHQDIYARTLEGDPTPFKAFRRREYLETVARMGHLPEDAPLGQRLVEEICMTREVQHFVQWLRERGCLLVAVSDKPDEATVPTPDKAAEGYLPLHRMPTHVIGQHIAELLP